MIWSVTQTKVTQYVKSDALKYRIKFRYLYLNVTGTAYTGRSCISAAYEF